MLLQTMSRPLVIAFIKWDHFDILAKGRSDIYCRVKETFLIRDLKPTLNENVSSESSIFISF